MPTSLWAAFPNFNIFLLQFVPIQEFRAVFVEHGFPLSLSISRFNGFRPCPAAKTMSSLSPPAVVMEVAHCCDEGLRYAPRSPSHFCSVSIFDSQRLSRVAGCTDAIGAVERFAALAIPCDAVPDGPRECTLHHRPPVTQMFPALLSAVVVKD